MPIYLTGSRRFGSANEHSDFDLFTQHSPELKADLISHGFEDLGNGGHCGPNLASMMRKKLPNGRQVDLGLYHNSRRKLREQRILEFTPIRLFMRHAPKETRIKLWGILQRQRL